MRIRLSGCAAQSELLELLHSIRFEGECKTCFINQDRQMESFHSRGHLLLATRAAFVLGRAGAVALFHFRLSRKPKSCPEPESCV